MGELTVVAYVTKVKTCCSERGEHQIAIGAVAATLALVGSLFVVEAPAKASPSPINRTNSQIGSLQTRAQALAEQITTDQNKVSVDAEAYDEYTVDVQLDQLKLVKIERQLQQTRTQLRAVRTHAENAAVEAYVTGDGFDSEVGGILDSSVNDAQSAAVYSDVVVHTLKVAAAELHVITLRLANERATQARTRPRLRRVLRPLPTGQRPSPSSDGERAGRPEPGQGPARSSRIFHRNGDYE